MTRTTDTIFSLISDAETNICAINDFALALLRISEKIDNSDGIIVYRLASEIKDRCDAIDESLTKIQNVKREKVAA